MYIRQSARSPCVTAWVRFILLPVRALPVNGTETIQKKIRLFSPKREIMYLTGTRPVRTSTRAEKPQFRLQTRQPTRSNSRFLLSTPVFMKQKKIMPLIIIFRKDRAKPSTIRLPRKIRVLSRTTPRFLPVTLISR